MLASSYFSWQYLLPNDLVAYSQSIIASLFFSSNFYFYGTTTEYGADSSLLLPFLHTWSLSVEEQFYLLFPVALTGLFLFFRKYLLLAILSGIVGSLLLAEYLSQINSALNFYILPTRGWELLIGTLLAYIDLNNKNRHHKTLYLLFPLVGIGLVFNSFLGFTEAIRHPGLATCIPVIGIALVIYFVRPDSIVGTVLGSRPVVGVGLISYSLYIWHFPGFAFGRIQNDAAGDSDKLLWLMLTIVLAIASYFLIERPFRNRQSIRTSPALISLLAIGISIAAINAVIITNNGFSDRLPKIFAENYKNNNFALQLKDENGENCHQRTSNFCKFVTDKNLPTITLIGDSHLSALQSNLLKRIKGRFNFLTMNIDGCWLARDFAIIDLSGVESTNCNAEIQQRRLARTYAHPNSIIIIGGRLPSYLSGKYFDNKEGGVEGSKWSVVFKDTVGNKSTRRGVNQTIKEVLAKGHKVTLVYPFVEIGWNVPKNCW